MINNYSLSKVLEEVKMKQKPSHHLYGLLTLINSGNEVILLDEPEKNFWNIVSNFLGGIPLMNLGNLNLQIKIFKMRKSYDIIYSPCQNLTTLLGLLRYFGLLNKEIVILAHHPFLKGRIAFLRKFSLYFSLSGHSKIASLSSVVASEINRITKNEKSTCLHWGPDIEYYDSFQHLFPSPEKIFDIVSIGRTGRDYKVLIDAFNNTEITVLIFCSKDFKESLDTEYSSNISLNFIDNFEQLGYPELIKLYKSAKIMAIPMFESQSLCGLTSITDALALAMPIVITRNSFIEIDIEQEQAGYWIEPNDSRQWYQKITDLLKNENLMTSMGRKSRSIAENYYNNEIYSKELQIMLNS